MFDIAIEPSGKYIRIDASKTFDPRKERQKIYATAEKEIRGFFNSMNLKHADNQIHPNDKEFLDISKIALRVPMEYITAAINQIFANQNGTPIRNLPAYIRTLANKMIS